MRSAPQGAYIIWILVSTVGLLQALASYYGWLGLSFFRKRLRLGYVFAALVIPASYYWFFSLTDRNVPGLEGWQLFSRFVIGVIGGLATALVLSSLVNASMSREKRETNLSSEIGLNALRYDTYVALLRRTISQAAPRERRGT